MTASTAFISSGSRHPAIAVSRRAFQIAHAGNPIKVGSHEHLHIVNALSNITGSCGISFIWGNNTVILIKGFIDGFYNLAPGYRFKRICEFD